MTVVTCEIKRWNNFKIISMFCFTLTMSEIILAAILTAPEPTRGE